MTTVNLPLTRQLLNLLQRLERLDSGLEVYEYQGGADDPEGKRKHFQTHPSTGTADSWTEPAQTLNQLASSLRAAAPDLAQVADRFNDHALSLTNQAGTIRSMAEGERWYSKGWGSLLDSTIKDVKAATLRIAGGLDIGSPQYGLVSEAVEMVSELSHVDGELQVYSGQGERDQFLTHPSEKFVQDRRDESRKLLDYSTRIRSELPGQEALAQDLAEKALWVSQQAGEMNLMQKRKIAFGKGWGETLDGTVNTVSKAVEVISSVIDSSSAAPKPAAHDAPAPQQTVQAPETVAESDSTKVSLGSLLDRG